MRPEPDQSEFGARPAVRSTRTRVTQVVPFLPPPFEGVGGFALRLAEALERTAGIESDFVALRQGVPPARANGEAEVSSLERSADSLVEILEGRPGPVILHFSSYGFAARGCPLWLAVGLGTWKKRAPDRPLITTFHEVWATGPPWRSSFWLHPFQRWIARRLVRSSDAAVTSLAIYGDALRRLGARAEPRVLPVFSAVGEPVSVPPLDRRPPRLVIFGGRGSRRRGYLEHREDLEAACRKLEIEEVVDVGPECDQAPGRVAGLPLRPLGALAPEAVRDVLLASRAGFLAYPPAFLPKSSMFAAYCAHGVVPVHAWSRAGDRFPLDPTLAWLPSGRDLAGPSDGLQELADRARSWYHGHDVGVHARLYRELIEGSRS